MQAGQAAGIFVGLDVGGTKTAALIVDQSDCILGQASQPTDTANPKALLASVNRTVHVALQEAHATPQQIQGVGVGVPGQVDPAKGLVQLAVNLNLKTYPLGSAISAQFKAPTFLENDVRIAAIGAYNYLRQTEPIQHMAYLSIGTGIAAGVILDGRLYRGHNGMAGEIGHTTVDPNGDLCNCGLRGCLETIVSGPAIMRQLIAAEPQTERHIQHAGDVYRLAATGHAAAQKIVQHVSLHLSRAIQWLLMTYDVEKVMIGGGVSRSGQLLLAPVLHEIARLRRQSSLAAELLLDEKLHLIPPDFNPGVWGAVHLARQTTSREIVQSSVNERHQSSLQT